jgi:hypothetical protein
VFLAERDEFPGEGAQAKEEGMPLVRGHRGEHALVVLVPGVS